MLKSAVILAGGLGTRLQSVVKDLPKPMAPVAGKPFLNYQLRYLQHHGIQQIYLSVGYLAESITEHFGQQFEGMELHYVHEKTALGTGGGIRLALEKCKEEEVLAVNGDSYFGANLNRFYDLHRKSKAQHSIALRSVENASRYGAIECDTENRIVSFKEKNSAQMPGLINGGIYILNKELFLKQTPGATAFSIEKDYFETKLNETCIYGFVFEAYFIDIGVPEDYLKAQNDFKGFTY